MMAEVAPGVLLTSARANTVLYSHVPRPTAANERFQRPPAIPILPFSSPHSAQVLDLSPAPIFFVVN